MELASRPESPEVEGLLRVSVHKLQSQPRYLMVVLAVAWAQSLSSSAEDFKASLRGGA